MFISGSYDYDGSRLYMTHDNKVHYCKPNDATSLLTWPSLEEMLESEITRLYKLFDDKGVMYDESASTLPVV